MRVHLAHLQAGGQAERLGNAGGAGPADVVPGDDMDRRGRGGKFLAAARNGGDFNVQQLLQAHRRQVGGRAQGRLGPGNRVADKKARAGTQAGSEPEAKLRSRRSQGRRLRLNLMFHLKSRVNLQSLSHCGGSTVHRRMGEVVNVRTCLFCQPPSYTFAQGKGTEMRCLEETKGAGAALNLTFDSSDVDALN